MARRAIVKGRVQGVGYRFFAERAARECGVRGWVRNLPDGSVEAVAEGDDASVARFLARLREGPHGSRVDSLAEEEQTDSGFASFEITH
ncbi:MAG TPA: acylphosphatase [Thermoanaerobaculia bacterium]|jgi:acylphosphatase